MEYYNPKPNSHRYKAEHQETSVDKPKMRKIVSGSVKTKKKSGMTKFADIFISENVSNVKSYLLMDVLLPAIKNTIEDVVTNGIRMILRGDTSARKSSSSRASNISYSRYYDKYDRRDEDRYSSPRRREYEYDEIVFESRGEAEAVLRRLDEAIDEYGQVTVADLYDLAGITGEYTDNNYGWMNIRNAEAVRVRDGYVLKMPKALPISK